MSQGTMEVKEMKKLLLLCEELKKNIPEILFSNALSLHASIPAK